MKFEGATFLISGGGSGLGEATARALVARGSNAVIVDLDEERAADVAEDLGQRAAWIRADVTSEDDIIAAVDLACSTYGGISGAISCAGIAIGERTVGRNGPHSLESFVKVVTVNLVGTFNVTRLVAARIAQIDVNAAEDERGVIISAASIAAYDGQVGQAAYAASKGGVVALTLPLARELAAIGVRVVTIAPGVFATPMVAGLPAAAQENLASSVPFPRRLGRPSEFAALACHVIENPMINGEVIRLDGALRMPPR